MKKVFKNNESLRDFGQLGIGERTERETEKDTFLCEEVETGGLPKH